MKYNNQNKVDHKYNTRFRIGTKTHNTELFKKTPAMIGAKFLKHLPRRITDLKGNDSLLKALKEYFIEKSNPSNILFG